MEHTAVMLMLCVTTPGDPITVRVKMDFMEMAKSALVSICNIFCSQTISNETYSINSFCFFRYRRVCQRIVQL